MDDKLPTRRCCERPARAALLLALAVAPSAGCTSPIGTTAASALIHVRDDPDPNHRYLAYGKLGSPNLYDNEAQKAEAVQVLLEKLEAGKEPVASRAVICRTLGILGVPAARGAMVKAVDDSEGLVRAEACRALGKVGRPEDATVLSRILATDSLLDCKVAAIAGIAELKASDPRFLQVLVENMDDDVPAIRLAALNALKEITRKDLGIEPAPWRKFVQEQAQARTSLAPTPKPPADSKPKPRSDPAVRPARTRTSDTFQFVDQ